MLSKTDRVLIRLILICILMAGIIIVFQSVYTIVLPKLAVNCISIGEGGDRVRICEAPLRR